MTHSPGSRKGVGGHKGIWLMDIPPGSKLRLQGSRDGGKMVWFVGTFHHLDGMYSYCTWDGVEPPNTFHLKFSTPLKRKGKYYEITDTPKRKPL